MQYQRSVPPLTLPPLAAPLVTSTHVLSQPRPLELRKRALAKCDDAALPLERDAELKKRVPVAGCSAFMPFDSTKKKRSGAASSDVC